MYNGSYVTIKYFDVDGVCKFACLGWIMIWVCIF